TSGLKVSWHRQRHFIRRERKKGDLSFEFFPMLSMLGTPEDELVVDQVRARVPPLSDQMGSSNGKPCILLYNLPPIRVHDVIGLTRQITLAGVAAHQHEQSAVKGDLQSYGRRSSNLYARGFSRRGLRG